MSRYRDVTSCEKQAWLLRVINGPTARGCACLMLALLSASTVSAEITTTGDVAPDPHTTTAGDDLYVGQTGDGTLLINDDSDVASRNSYIAYDAGINGQVQVDDAGSTWTQSDTLYLGLFGSACLDIINGGTVNSANSYIAMLPGSQGAATISGLDSFWNITDILYLGAMGAADLTVTDHATLNTHLVQIAMAGGSTGSLTLDGPGSTWNNDGTLYVGKAGQATVTISNGGQFNCPATAVLGDETGSSGTVMVEGPDSIWQQPESGLIIGNFGHGALTVRQGASANFGKSLYLAYYAGSTGQLSFEGPGSSLTNTPVIYVGHKGAGLLNISEGAQVSTSWVSVAASTGSSGQVVVTGAETLWDARSSIDVGEGGDGQMLIAQGATVRVKHDVTIGSWNTSTGTVTVDGPGTFWDVGSLGSSGLMVGKAGSGTLQITHGAAVHSEISVIGDWTEASGSVTVDGAGSIWTNYGENLLGIFSNDLPEPFETVNLVVGEAGHGSLAVTDGGTAITGGVVVGWDVGSTGAVAVQGSGSQWLMADALLVGYQGEGTLQIADAAQVQNADAFIAYAPGSTGHVTVTGKDSSWTNHGSLFVGGNDNEPGGQATLTLADHATIAVAQNLTVWGGGHIDQQSGRLIVATNPTGLPGDDGLYVGGGTESNSLRIEDGGSVNVTSTRIAETPGSSGWISLSGSGATLNNQYGVSVGGWGDGILDISHGATLNSTSGIIGLSTFGNGSVVVYGQGSAWNIENIPYRGPLTVGYAGRASLLILDQGQVRSNYGSLGEQPGSTGRVTITGIGSRWTLLSTTSPTYQSTNSPYVTPEVVYYGLAVGRRGEGTLYVLNGGALEAGLVSIGHNLGSTGRVTISGDGSTFTFTTLAIGNKGSGTLNIDHNAQVSGNSATIGSSGIVNLTSGSLTVDELRHNNGGEFNFTGGSLQVGAFHGSLLNSAGTLIAAGTAGTTQVLGDYQQMSDAALRIAINQTTGCDQVIVSEVAALAGSLDLELTAGYLPTLGDAFTFLTADSLTGAFQHITGLLLGDDLALAVTYTDTTADILVVLPGDADTDGQINLADLNILGDHWGTSGAYWSMGDFTGDGQVNLADLQIIGDHWNPASGDLAGIAATFIPEPAALSLLLLLSTALIRRRA